MAEGRMIKKEIAKIEEELGLVDKKLSNKKFCSRAPGPVVEKAKKRRVELKEKRTKLKKHMQYFTAG